MPQMAPLNWLSLYFLFILLYVISIIMNYYSFSYQPKSFSIKKSLIQINWKW